MDAEHRGRVAEGLINAGHEVIACNRSIAPTQPLAVLGVKAVVTYAASVIRKLKLHEEVSARG